MKARPKLKIWKKRKAQNKVAKQARKVNRKDK